MLVIISDLHLSDGTTGDSIGVEAFRSFRQRLRDLAYDASWRRDNSYRPVEEIDLVLLGDVLDVIRSTGWLAEDGAGSALKPWSDSRSKPFIDRVGAITAAVLKYNADSLAVLKSLTREGAITLPIATPAGRPAEARWEPDSPNRQPVRVRIHYLVGNHDWFYHLPGPEYDQLRQTVADAIGCATPAGSPFPHDPYESGAIRQIYESHRVYARHGDIYDSFNFAGNRDESSLGDAVVVELVDRFAMTVKKELGNRLPPAAIDGLKEIDNLRPTVIIPAWVDGLLRKTCPDPALQKKVTEIWKDLVDQLVRLDFVRHSHGHFHLSASLEEFKLGMRLSEGVLRADLSRLFAWIVERGSSQEGSYSRYALKEEAFQNRSARFVVYGHTHYYELVPLQSTAVNGGILDQIYINSGTWRPYHQLVPFHPEREEFVRYQVMVYLAFFKDGENRGRPFESWSGALGPLKDASATP